MIKILTTLLLLPVVLYGDVLPFQEGSSANYSVTQHVDYSLECFGITQEDSADYTFGFTMTVVSFDETTSSYPFDVEVVLAPSTEADALLQALSQETLEFTVSGPFDIEETSGILEQLCEKYSNSHSVFTIESDIQLAVAQIFHLSGENLQSDYQYPISCYKILNYADEPLMEKDITVDENSAYTMGEVDADTLTATLQGIAKVVDTDQELHSTLEVAGNVAWDAVHPLVQQRTLQLHFDQISEGYFPLNIHGNLTQTITSN